MSLFFIRTFFWIVSTLLGYYLGTMTGYPWLGLSLGASGGLFLIVIEGSLRRVSVRGLTSMVFGLLLGLFMANLISSILSILPLDEFIQSVSNVVLILVFSYLGAVMALRGKDEFHLIIPYVRFRREDSHEGLTLLDTSAIIDGRIVDIYKTNFFLNRLVVPRFVLQELQKLSDSEDPNKRQRGRRGMEILRNMQKDPTIDLRIHEDEVPGYPEVDAKLIRLAKIMDARICTTDYNLSRVATIQGITLLNINDLANAVKIAVFPGDEIEVKLTKEGRERDQAVAHTDDGTMIVVSDARHLIGKKVMVVINSVLQTQGGKMIFAKVKG
ncbi:MAG: TRAM domain-containing protein [Candidatus Omnitrophica bacterium]|nr:TRAM domain-containing protein [Candidatus Omnitrophota bacterium]